MIDKKYLELIHKEIDGVITKTEQAKLARYLSITPEAQNYYDELRQLSGMLRKISMVESPPNIKKRVLNSIDLTRYATTKKRIGLRTIFSGLFFKPIPKLAYAFALGIVVGILGYSVLLKNVIVKQNIEGTDVYGTIGIEAKAGWKVVKEIPITLPEIEGTVSIKRFENIVMLETDMRTLKTIEIKFEYAASNLKFSHFSSGCPSKISFDVRESYIQASFSGDIQYAFFFNKIVAETKTLELKLFSAGALCYTQTISL